MASAPRRSVPPVVPQSPEARSYFSSRGYRRREPAPPPGVDDPHEVEDWDTIHGASAMRPDTPHVRALRFLNATGDLLAISLLAGAIAGDSVLPSALTEASMNSSTFSPLDSEFLAILVLVAGALAGCSSLHPF